MKAIQRCIMVIIAIVLIDSCTKKETTPPSAAETNGTLLAGAKGASKNWNLTSMLGSVNGSTPQDIQVLTSTSFPACELDNVFQFSNNSTQSFQHSEGGSLCTSGDPTVVESGSWALTNDGKTLLIDAIVNATSTQVQSAAEPFLGYMILAWGAPLTVLQLTATSLKVSYTYVYNSDTYVITLVFAKN